MAGTFKLLACQLLMMIFLVGYVIAAPSPDEALIIRDTIVYPLRPIANWLGADISLAQANTVAITLRAHVLRLPTDGRPVTYDGTPLPPGQGLVRRHGVSYLPAELLHTIFKVTATIDKPSQIATLAHPTNESSRQYRIVKVNPFDDSDMIWIQAGDFVMGTPGVEYLLPPDERERRYRVDVLPFSNEYPAHIVYLPGYWIDRYPVTVNRYRKFCRATKRKMPVVTPGHEQQPMCSVSWTDAEAYAKWAQGRLPSEAEWEKAARGTDSRIFSWGDHWSSGVFGDPKRMSSLVRPRVGSMPGVISPFGVGDMAGMVREWCGDWYAADYYRQSPYYKPSGPATGLSRSIRGSVWPKSSPWRTEYRCAYRSNLPQESRAADLGFRVVLPVSTTTRPARVNQFAVPLGPIASPELLFGRHFPPEYRCVGAWHADLNSDGQGEIVAVAISASSKAISPLLKVMQRNGAASLELDAYTFDQGDAIEPWLTLSADSAFDGLPSASSLFVRDLNNDGRLEIGLCLRSNGLRGYDEALFLLQWSGKGQLALISRVLFRDAVRGAWLIDDLSPDYPGMEVVTVGRIFEESPTTFQPHRYRFSYYIWSDNAYALYQTKSTNWKYDDALGALANLE